jgi:hypothetical protein
MIFKGITNLRSRSYLVKDQNGELLADSHILNRWKNYFSQLLNVYRVRHTEIHTAEPLVSDPSTSEVEIGTAKMKW